MRLFSNRVTYEMLSNHSNIIIETGHIIGQTQQRWENRLFTDHLVSMVICHTADKKLSGV